MGVHLEDKPRTELWKHEIKDETSTCVDVEKPYFVVVSHFWKELQRESALFVSASSSLMRLCDPAAHDNNPGPTKGPVGKERPLTPHRSRESEASPCKTDSPSFLQEIKTRPFLFTKTRDQKNDRNGTEVERLSRGFSLRERTFCNSKSKKKKKKPPSPHFCVWI